MIRAWGITDQGKVRQQNQDAYYLDIQAEDLALGLVCDGMGGARAGNVASTMAVAAFIETVNRMPGELREEPEAILAQGVEAANAAVYQRSHSDPDCWGMGTTMVGALVLGYLLMHLFSTSTNLSGDVCSTLFGSTAILTLSPLDVGICIAVSVVVIAVFLLFYHKIFAVTFDETFAEATGLHAGRYNLLIAVITAAVIVLAMNLVGSLLISALIIFPALSAMRLFKSFRAVILCSAVLSVVCAAAGIFVSILGSTPVGSTIVAMDIAAFIVCWAVGKVLKR